MECHSAGERHLFSLFPNLTDTLTNKSIEKQRLQDAAVKQHGWRRWGPYVSERSWGTVREDYSSDGNAWGYFPHDHARSKAFRWGEDGLAGYCDRYQLLIFSLALWNGNDPILKERLFGVVPSEANHGEDVKEYYYYLDATPTHSYLKYLYKYPHKAYPYEQLLNGCRSRSKQEGEYELLDTGVLDENRYFDVYVEYAKASPEDTCIRIEVFNRGPEPASIDLVPQLWFRKTWGWDGAQSPQPILRQINDGSGLICIEADEMDSQALHNLMTPYTLGKRYLYAAYGGIAMFTDNETNFDRLNGTSGQNKSPFVKDAFHRQIVNGESCTNPQLQGTKACVRFQSEEIPAGGSKVFLLRLTDRMLDNPLADVDMIVAQRKTEADAFYEEIQPPKATADEKLVQRQALAGMIWTKQIYLFDVRKWMEGDDPNLPPPANRPGIRNKHWKHLNSMRILSMPDKWEYPWFAAWDLAFHCIPLALVDPDFAKEQLWLLLFEQFQHPSGQIPAYEWEFSDLNPPVHAWAVWRVYNMDRIQKGKPDRVFLEKCFHKLLINFAWWVNKVDSEGNNIFEGGFLGLDNITLFDRSQTPTDGATLKQADATGWMGMYCLNMMRMALELAKENASYIGLATKFFEHYMYIGHALKHMGGEDFSLWSETDALFYDVLSYPDGKCRRLRIHSLVSLIPLYATERLEESWIDAFPAFKANLHWFLRNRPEIAKPCLSTRENGQGVVHLLSLVTESQLQGMLQRMWDPNEFRSEYGLRSLSRFHEGKPYEFAGQVVRYEPGETEFSIKGGNSNWRGPIWFPTSFLMIESLRKLAKVYGEEMQVPKTAPETPTNNGEDPLSNPMKASTTLMGMASGYADSMISMFTRDGKGRRPIFGNREVMQSDPHWRDCLLFHEYFHADTGEGLGACHQTGWTGLVACLIDEWRR